MSDFQSGNERHVCIVNVGLFRSGTTTLVEAARSLGMKAFRKFPDLTQDQHLAFLQNPKKVVSRWASNDGRKEFLRLAASYDLICDGWIALLPFLAPDKLNRYKEEAADLGVHLEFVASTRDVESTVNSELHHWTIHDLERKAGLTSEQRQCLEHSIRERAVNHQYCVEQLHEIRLLKRLPLSANFSRIWSETLSQIIDLDQQDWSDAFDSVGIKNASPPLPIEGILLTLRLGSGRESDDKIASIEKLLDQIELDSICSYLIVLAIDSDEKGGAAAAELVRRLKLRAERGQQLKSVHTITNPRTPSTQPFPVCSVWNEMAIEAWKNGADWVVLLGDDVKVRCSYHYRAFYRSFLDIAKHLKVPFGFGCPWWNDETFAGFPTFPCVGKTHCDIFGALIPEHRKANFVNQDLDPYLQHLYLKFMAAPCVSEAVLVNGAGGNVCSGAARYERVPAEGWHDFVFDDVDPIRKYLPDGTPEALLLDVIVPSYRVQLDYLLSICSLKVPVYIHTFFIIIVDNFDALLRSVALIIDQKSTKCTTLNEGERILEEYLSQSGNNVRVRCNKTNLGASASRNRGLEESAAEYVLHLDDDLKPNEDLLEQYGRKLLEIDDTVVGLIGLVRFPRSPTLPLIHAAVLMSYLTFMFEIAERNLYSSPAWGVTANILFRRTSVRFDLAYAKTGGGEDVDFCLRVAEASNDGKLLVVPEACVVHPFWPGSVLTLSSHFFNWAIGDGGLLKRFPEYRYWSYPNLPETLFLLFPFSLWIGPWTILHMVPWFLAADFVVDFSRRDERYDRCLLVQGAKSPTESLERSRLFYFSGHILANLYVVVLECGRLWGHLKRKDLSGVCHRFDWHCGRLENAPHNFRRREAQKFALFVGVVVFQVFAGTQSLWLLSDDSTVRTCGNSLKDPVYLML